jgi:hypothetical protein
MTKILPNIITEEYYLNSFNKNKYVIIENNDIIIPYSYTHGLIAYIYNILFR